MYQVAWQRLLTVHYGVGAISTTLIVSVYMFGLGVGALLGGFLAERSKNKIILYFMIEFLIGCFGVISLPFLDFLGRHTAGSNYFISFFYMVSFLCLPTILMGITLPLLTKIFNSIIRNFLNTVSLLYFVNTIGAAVGAVVTSYVIISFFGLDSAVFCAASINFVLALLIFIARFIQPVEKTKASANTPSGNKEAIFGRIAYLLVFITGFLAIGYEIVWFRVVGILLKSSPYAFSTVLSVYLAGIAMGSFNMNKYLKKNKSIDKKKIFFLLQFLIGLCVIVVFAGYYYLTKYTMFGTLTQMSFSADLHPHLQIPSLDSLKVFLKGVYSLADVFFWPVLFVLTPTMFMGASFPLISLLALSDQDKEGKTVGTVYFYNISGNVFGGIVTGFVLMPYLGTEVTLLGFSIIGLLFGLFVSMPVGEQAVEKRIAFVSVLIMITIIFFPGKSKLYETMHTMPGDEYASYFNEGRDGTVMTYENNEKILTYINGLSHGARPSNMFLYEVYEAMSFAKEIRKILIIGFGTGSTTEAILKVNSVENVTLVELNHELINNLSRMPLFEEILSNHKLSLVIDDGRRFLLQTNEKYDLIFIDALRLETSHSNNLYSRQFFSIAHQHLNPRGIFMSVTFGNGIINKTLQSVFEATRIYGVFTLASNKPFKIDDSRRKRIFDVLKRSEQEFLLGKESERARKMDYYEKDFNVYPVNEDWKPVSEYYIGSKVRGIFND